MGRVRHLQIGHLLHSFDLSDSAASEVDLLQETNALLFMLNSLRSIMDGTPK